MTDLGRDVLLDGSLNRRPLRRRLSQLEGRCGSIPLKKSGSSSSRSRSIDGLPLCFRRGLISGIGISFASYTVYSGERQGQEVTSAGRAAMIKPQSLPPHLFTDVDRGHLRVRRVTNL
jgi:hypothetical protein